MIMDETEPGFYSGQWVVAEDINATELDVEVNFTNRNGEEIREFADGRVNILMEEPVDPEDPEVDKTLLAAVIAEALGKNENDYTEESWIPFEDALFAAIYVNEDEAAAQGEVDAALIRLSTCMNELVLKESPVEEPEVFVEVENSSPNFFPALIKLRAVVTNLPGAARYDVVYWLSGGEEGNTSIYDLGTWTEEAIFFNPRTITDIVYIRIYDDENNLIYTFTDVVLENPLIP